MNDNKPIELKIEDTKNNIIIAINDVCKSNDISSYFLEMILKEIYQESVINKNKEITILSNNFNKKEE